MNKARLESTDRGPTVVHNGRYLYSKRNPHRTPERIAQSVLCKHNCLYLVPSPLLGYGLEVLVNRIPDDSLILAFEYSSELFGLCTPHITEELIQHPHIEWARLSDTPSMAVLLERIGLWKFRRVYRVDLNGGASVNPDLYNRLCVFAQGRLVNYWKNRHTLGRMGRSWIRHLFSNLIALSRNQFESIQTINQPSSLMTVVVGAGPSLDEGLSFLKQNRNLIRIICTDTALSTLLSSGIKPEAISVLETQAWNLLDFHGAVNSFLPILADLTSYPPTMTVTGGPVIPFTTAFADLNLFDRLEEAGLRPLPLPPLGSVGLSSVELSLRLFSGPVLLIGIDFGYKPGISHAKGTSVHQWQLISRNRTNPYPGFAATMLRPKFMGSDARGRSFRTDSVLKGYADLFIDCYSKEERLYVLSPGGLNLSLPLLNADEATKLAFDASRQNRHSDPKGRITGNGIPSSPDPSLFPSKAALFLKKELKRLNNVIEAWDSYASGAISSDLIVKVLESVDYIYCDFPDEPPLPKNEDSFLVRAVRRARELKKLIERSSP